MGFHFPLKGRIQRILIILTLFILNTNTAVAQQKNGFGIHAGVAIPMGTLGNRQTIGYEIGTAYRHALPFERLKLITGISFLELPGKRKVRTSGYMRITTHYSNFYLTKISLGTFIGAEEGFYMLPTLCYSRYEDVTYPGINLKAGYLLPMQNKIDKLNVFGQLGIVDVIREEKIGYILGMGLGIFFY